VTTTRPRQFRRERCEDVVQRLGNDDVVINCYQSVQYHVSNADTCEYQRFTHRYRAQHALCQSEADLFMFGRIGAFTKMGSTGPRPENFGQQRDIFWLVGPLYRVLQHFKVYLVQHNILWSGEGRGSVRRIRNL